jgi:hypothetical protein
MLLPRMLSSWMCYNFYFIILKKHLSFINHSVPVTKFIKFSSTFGEYFDFQLWQDLFSSYYALLTLQKYFCLIFNSILILAKSKTKSFLHTMLQMIVNESRTNYRSFSMGIALKYYLNYLPENVLRKGDVG